MSFPNTLPSAPNCNAANSAGNLLSFYPSDPGLLNTCVVGGPSDVPCCDPSNSVPAFTVPTTTPCTLPELTRAQVLSQQPSQVNAYCKANASAPNVSNPPNVAVVVLSPGQPQGQCSL